MPTLDDIGSYRIRPNPWDPKLSRVIKGVDQNGRSTETSVIEERPLTIYLNSQEIVTAMTIGGLSRISRGRLFEESGDAEIGRLT